MNPTTCKSCGLPIFHGPAGYAGPQCMCRWTNAAPRQPEGEGLEVVAYRKPYLSSTDFMPHEPWCDDGISPEWEPLCRLSGAQRAIAELREVNRIQLEVASVHGAACVEIRKERDTLRQQRYKLAGLLRTIAVGISKREMPTEQQLNAWFDQIDAALDEVGK